MTISKKNMKWIPWLLILPVVLIRGFTTVYPILMTVKNSFFNISILAGINEFIGFKNYLKVFSDPKVLTSISFTAIFVVVSMILHVILGVILALILNMKFKGRRFLRTIVLIPWAMPAVVAGMAAKWAFNNDYGLINDFIRWFVPGYQNSWLINTGTARAAVIAMDLWKDLPFFAILVLSGLQFISGDIYEAAKVDGANGIQSFFRITLPLIAKNVLTLCIPFTLWRLTTFDLVYSMTSGGPGEDTALIAYRITTEAFTNLNVGYASALAMLLFAFTTVLGWSQYGTKAVEYLFGEKATKIYKVIFVVMILSGAVMTSSLAWDISDTFNGLMMLPNLIGVVVLCPMVMKITKNYVNRKIKGIPEEPVLSHFPDIQAEAAASQTDEV